MGRKLLDSRKKGPSVALQWAKNAKNLKRVILNKKPLKIAATPKPKAKFKQGWREFGGKRIYYRSRWEANFGLYLQWQKEHGEILDWLHEPETFWFEGIKRGCVSYLPDFKVIKLDGTHEWIEVKGWMDPKSKTKINRFRKYYPKETLRIVGAKWYKSNTHKLAALIPAWEKG